ncbi:MAG: VWA domain-containing protein [Vicinamibacterales bacterium]
MIRTPRLRVAVLLLTIGATSVFALLQASPRREPQRETRQRHLVVGVLGKNDIPTPSLTAKDFVIREDGIAREVVSVSSAAAPTHLVLLVDDSEAMQSLTIELRAGLEGFLERIRSGGQAPAVRLATFGERPNTQVEFTTTPAAITAGVERIAPRVGSGSMLLEALIETCRDLRTRHAERPVIVAFVNEQGPELSSDTHTEVINAVKSAGASLWTVVLQDQGGQGTSDPAHERAQVLAEATAQSGGFNKTILSRQGLPPAFQTVATALSSRYELTYVRPDSLIPPTRLDVQVRDRSLRVLASKWIGQ